MSTSFEEKAKYEKKQIFFFCSFSDVFCWFQRWNPWKRIIINKKGWKRLKKSSSTCFHLLQSPESWLKYTTHVFSLQVVNEILSDIEDGADFRDEGPFPVSSEQEEEEHFAPSNRWVLPAAKRSKQTSIFKSSRLAVVVNNIFCLRSHCLDFYKIWSAIANYWWFLPWVGVIIDCPQKDLFHDLVNVIVTSRMAVRLITKTITNGC